MLRQLGEYLQTACGGEESIILSADYDVRKKSEPIGPLAQGTGLLVRYGINSGEVTLECDVIHHAMMYDFAYTEAPVTSASRWETVSNSKRRVNLNGLRKGVEYVFRVTGMNTDPTRNWSEPVTKLVV